MTQPAQNLGKGAKGGLIFGLIILIPGVGLLVYHNRWIRSVFQGPVPITLADLQKLDDPATLSNPWVSFTFDQAVDTGFVMQQTRSGDTRQRSKYLLIEVGKRWLLADVPADFAGNHAVGYLDKWWSPLSNKVIDQVKGRFRDRDILPYQFNAEYSYRSECYSLLGVSGFFIVAGVALCGYALAAMRKATTATSEDPVA
jgi:hypothetical protein